MNENHQEYAEFIIRELVAEADNGHVRETSAVVFARHWVELQERDSGVFTSEKGERT